MNNSITLEPTGTSGPVGIIGHTISGFNNTVIGLIGLNGPQGRPGPIGMTNIEYRKHLRTKKILKLLEKWDLTNATSTKKQLFDSTKIKAYQN